MTAQIFKTPAGEEMVFLSKVEYDDLVARADDFDEDEADVAIYDQRTAEMASL